MSIDELHEALIGITIYVGAIKSRIEYLVGTAEKARDETNNAQHATREQEELALALNELVSRFKL